jgi:hypothetical protein
MRKPRPDVSARNKTQHMSGSKNPNSSIWKVINIHTGHEEIIDDCKGYCKINGLSYGAVTQASAKGNPHKNLLFIRLSKKKKLKS